MSMRNSPSKRKARRFPLWEDRGDPLAASRRFATNERWGRRLTVTSVIAAMIHGLFVAEAMSSPVELRQWVDDTRQQVQDYLWTTYDVELPEPPEPEPAKERPEQETTTAELPPAPPRAAKPRAKAQKKPAESPPPAAKAGKILTAPEQPDDEPVDLTDQGFVTGDAGAYVGGVTAAAGTGSTATYNTAAAVTGVPGGRATDSAPPPQPPPAPKVDRSRPATVSRGANWSSCPFPEEADMDQIDYAVVTLMVTVRPDGSARSVKVLRDPGHGFGRAARLCALSMRYVPALDKDGNPTLGTTPPINVRFTR